MSEPAPAKRPRLSAGMRYLLSDMVAERERKAWFSGYEQGFEEGDGQRGPFPTAVLLVFGTLQGIAVACVWRHFFG